MFDLHVAGPAERELERLIKKVVEGTRFQNRVFAVGGYVRDELLGKEPADLDVAVELPYGAQRLCGFLQDLFPEVQIKPVTMDYPVWYCTFPTDVQHEGETYRVTGAELDVTDTQSILQTNGGVSTQYGTKQQDVERRDFTVNMLFKDLSSGEIIDPSGTGRSDLAKGLLRPSPDAQALRNFQQQPRQILRLLRFMLQYGWQPSAEVLAAAKAAAPLLADVSGDALRKEFKKLKTRGLLDRAVPLLQQLGLVEPLRVAWRSAKQEETNAKSQ